MTQLTLPLPAKTNCIIYDYDVCGGEWRHFSFRCSFLYTSLPTISLAIDKIAFNNTILSRPNTGLMSSSHSMQIEFIYFVLLFAESWRRPKEGRHMQVNCPAQRSFEPSLELKPSELAELDIAHFNYSTMVHSPFHFIFNLADSLRLGYRNMSTI